MSRTAVDFAAFDIEDLQVLDINDAVALPEMGASIIINNFVDDAEGLVDETELSSAAAVSISSSSSCCCC
ncbi:thiopeptide-type bacteriocin [Kitasatospora sp. NPDC088391]|uniref:thiopeptide-type bacteriocin n=1 Tax=Kitasatospora sp. NPDC088391 TaxID=3364074 RepID=UPI003806F15D